MHKNLRRSVVALFTTLACFAIMASPTSATRDVVAITGGTIVAQSANGATVITSTLGGTAGAGCTSTIAVEVGTGSHSGTSDITTFTSTGHFIFGGNHYVATITRTASTAGTFGTSSTGGTINSLGFTATVQLRNAGVNSSTNLDCTTPGTLVCTLRAVGHLNGTYDGHMSDISNNFHVATSANGTLASIPPGCGVPFATLNGGNFSITSLTGHTTSTS